MKRLFNNNKLIFILVLIVGCSKDLDTLQDRGGLKYEINSSEPFSGSVYREYESGKKEIKGYFKNGKQDGLWSGWNEDGQKDFQGTYKDGELDGLWTDWYSNGQKKYQGTWKDSRKDGLWTEWYKSGEERSKKTYENGFKVTYKNGEYGFKTLWWDNGQKKYEGTWDVHTEWYENGQKKREKKDGYFIKSWYENGQKESEGTWKNNKFISSKEWNKDGTIKN